MEIQLISVLDMDVIGGKGRLHTHNICLSISGRPFALTMLHRLIFGKWNKQPKVCGSLEIPHAGRWSNQIIFCLLPLVSQSQAQLSRGFLAYTTHLCVQAKLEERRECMIFQAMLAKQRIFNTLQLLTCSQGTEHCIANTSVKLTFPHCYLHLL